MSQQIMELLSTAVSALQQVAQLVQQGVGTAQVQQGLPQQQAFGNPGGMQGAANQQFTGAISGQNVAQAGLPGQQGGAGQQFGGGFGAGAGTIGQPQGQPQAFGAQANTGAQVTPDMIQQLITPLVQNEQVKTALTQQMLAMGIQNLPDARPDQLPELYQRFMQVQQQAQAAGLLGGGGGAPAAAPSII